MCWVLTLLTGQPEQQQTLLSVSFLLLQIQLSASHGDNGQYGTLHWATHQCKTPSEYIYINFMRFLDGSSDFYIFSLRIASSHHHATTHYLTFKRLYCQYSIKNDFHHRKENTSSCSEVFTES